MILDKPLENSGKTPRFPHCEMRFGNFLMDCIKKKFIWFDKMKLDQNFPILLLPTRRDRILKEKTFFSFDFALSL